MLGGAPVGLRQGLGLELCRQTPTCSGLLPACFLTQLVFRSQDLPLPCWCQQTRAPSGGTPPNPFRLLEPGAGWAPAPRVPPQPVLCARSQRPPAGTAATPATSAAAASTSWSGPAPRGASSTAGASSAGSAGPPCAWATTPAMSSTVRQAAERACAGEGFSTSPVIAWASGSSPPGHFYCSLHYPNPTGMDPAQEESPVLPDGVSCCKSPWKRGKVEGDAPVLHNPSALGCCSHALGCSEPMCVPQGWCTTRSPAAPTSSPTARGRARGSGGRCG